MLLRASSIACWTVFEERQALSITFLSDAASSLSSFIAMDSSGVVTSQVALLGRVVVSPPIFFLVCRFDGVCFACFLAAVARLVLPRQWLSLQGLAALRSTGS